MPESITPALLKEQNKRLIYQLIYNQRRISQQDIAYRLHLSRPTVASRLNELETEGLIQKEGQIASFQAGRKAAAYTINADYRISVGVDLGSSNFSIAVINLYGELLDQTTHFLDFEPSGEYSQKLASLIQQFVQPLCTAPDQILGIGFSLFPSAKKSDLSSLQEYLPYTVRFVSDADSAAISCLWEHPEISDALYLNLSYHLSTAMIRNGAIFHGLHGHGPQAEHLCVDPQGQKCSCGRQGCLETACALCEVLSPGEELSHFLQSVRAGDLLFRERFQSYLKALAKALETLLLVTDTTCILGGTMGAHLTEEDLSFLYKEIEKKLPLQTPRDYLRIHKTESHSLALGAALPFIWEFL